MPSPKSPIKLLVERLNNSTPLKGFVKVFAGKNGLAKGREPQTIVIYPVAGGYKDAHDNVDAFVDVDLKIAARLWAKPTTDDPDGTDGAWDMRQRYIAALAAQALGNPLDPNDAGFFTQFVDETWDTAPDTNQQGQQLEVITNIRLSASDRTTSYGQVDATSMTKTATLSADMLIGDAAASVDATSGYPATGVLHIDAEQMSYSGMTATSFTGLVRGINGTTAAAHTNGATVQITPT